LTLLDTDDGGEYDFIIDGLSKVWSNAQVEAPPEAVLAEDAGARVRRDVGKVWGRISSSQLTSARYTTFARARAIAEAFPRESDDATQTSLDVVNAAWLIRYRSWRDGVDPPRELVQWARHLLDPRATAKATSEDDQDLDRVLLTRLESVDVVLHQSSR